MPIFSLIKSSLFVFLFWLTAIGSSYAQDECKRDEGFIEASPIKRAPPIYPAKELISGNAGMAEIEMMVNEQGKIFAPIVIRSTSKKFEEEALKAAKKYRYEPATYEGKPVSSRTSIRINFHVRGEAEGVSRYFARIYRKASKELDKAEPDVEKIEKLLGKMKSARDQTNYALARYNLVALRKAMIFGDVGHQIEATRKLLMFDQKMSDKGRMLDADLLMRVRRSLFFALVQTQRYAEALELYKTIQKEEAASAAELDHVVAKITELRDGDGSSVVNIKIGSRGYTVEQLLKKSMMFSSIEGEISALKLRCDRHFKELPFQAESEYRIPDSWGQCLIEIVGKPGTTVELFEF